ncbi:MAG: metal-dependent hydrolase [Trueperaceae bacterium]|nr:metal-dependent hydrolase [Trueperaceae bacterium]MCC6309699.1 metal-dependent hydrolase [Trueperaceae bacterium]MCO5173835.1 metal-dependent hydrolase [Trueperaceae bacterium]MCW5818949.1 metal-dependent hydrolase [Trueperaceae bacterium]
MKLRYLGHSGVQVVADGHEVVFDPFVTQNPRAGVTLDELAPEAVLITHAHGDHWGDTPELAKRAGALVVGTAEVAGYAGKLGLTNHAMNIGGSRSFPFGRVTLTPAWHSSSFPDGTYGGMPTGIVLESAGKRIYHAGDTALFSDMRLIGRKPLDLAFVPIGDNFTMGPEDAVEAVKLLNPRYVVPVHYGTFPLIAQDAAAFKREVELSSRTTCVVLAPGEEVSL